MKNPDPPVSAAHSGNAISDDPKSAVISTYRNRLSTRQTALVAATELADRISNFRMGLFLGGVGLGILIWKSFTLSAYWFEVSLAGFIFFFSWLIFWHREVSFRRNRARGAVNYYTRALDRLGGLWPGQGKTGMAYFDPHHPYAADLDLFGVGSLFERLCAAETVLGERVLAQWFLHGADARTLLRRQLAVRELRDRLDWRENMALAATASGQGGQLNDLLHWAEAPPAKIPRVAPLIALILSSLTLITLIGFLAFHWGYYPLVGILGVQSVFVAIYRRRVQQILSAMQTPVDHLKDLRALFRILERGTWENDYLNELKKLMEVQGLLPSVQIGRLTVLLDWLESKRNQLFALLAGLLMWDTHFAFALERWRSRAGGAVGHWLEAIGTIEALNSLAGYHYENPQDPFPTILPESTPIFKAEGLGHPLLGLAQGVRNDVVLGERFKWFLISGSNMSGKSTCLRSVGSNAVLALAGAPVRAAALEISPLQIGATLRVQDSLTEGTSKFYAELVRLKMILELAHGKPPVLFLLDELLHGTNSHDRVTGAHAILKCLLERGAIGAVTTHDLSLAKMVDEFNENQGANFHFQEHFEAGKMRFDYKMRQGVVTGSNAIELIRSLGINV